MEAPVMERDGIVKFSVPTAGDGVNFPLAGDKIVMEYKGWLAKDYDSPNFDTSDITKMFDTTLKAGRGDFAATIGVGQLIQGWDKMIPSTKEGANDGMSLGERCLIRIPSALGYGARGFPPVIPPSSDLIFEIRLKQFTHGNEAAKVAGEEPARQ